MSDFLVGKTLNGMEIADDKKALRFLTDKGDAVVKVDGDCCSDSWVESIELPALGFPALVVSVEDLDMTQPEESPDEYEAVEVYGCKITTDKGEIVIDYRNGSNGYYGGNLSWPDDSYFYGGVHGQNVSSEKWVGVNDV